MSQENNQDFLNLLLGVRMGALTRRQVLKRGLALGLSTPVIMSLLAACGSDDDDDEPAAAETPDAPAAPTNTRVPVLAATNTPSTSSSEPTPAAASDRNESDNREFIMLFTGGVPDVDPQSAYDNQASSMFLATYEMLLRLKGESTFEYEPMLAHSWESNDELTEFTFEIAEGITFHDGTPCDAQAVVDSLTRFLEMGRGPVDVIKRFVPDPANMEAVNPTTIKFTMTKPEPLFLAAMASEYGPLIVSPAAMEENKTDADPYAHEWFAQNMVGTGPYQVTEAEAQERFVLDRYDGYQHGPDHFFDRIVARVVVEDVTRRQLIESGEAHGVAVLPNDDLIALRSNPDVQVVEYETTQCNWVRLNYVRLSAEARRGLCYAFPYDDVIEQVQQGFAKKQGPIADTVIGFDPSIALYDTDLEQARELLLEGGVTESDELEYILADGDATSQAIAELFQASLAEIGFNLRLVRVDRSALVDLNYGDTPPEERPHMASAGWWPDYNDSYNQLFPNFHPDSAGSAGSNSMFYGNEEVGELLDQARDAETEEELVDLTGQILQIMIQDDPAAIFYAQITRAQVLATDIRGFKPNGIYIASWNYHEMWREAT